MRLFEWVRSLMKELAEEVKGTQGLVQTSLEPSVSVSPKEEGKGVLVAQTGSEKLSKPISPKPEPNAGPVENSSTLRVDRLKSRLAQMQMEVERRAGSPNRHLSAKLSACREALEIYRELYLITKNPEYQELAEMNAWALEVNLARQREIFNS